MIGSPRVSVVIPTYRRRDALRPTLEALARQELPASAYEVVVAIDGSEDGTRELVESFDAPYTLRSLWQPNGGRSSACNAGVREARAELIVVLDDDIEATPGLLAAHLRAHDGATNRAVMGAVRLVCDETATPYVRHFAAHWDRKMAQLATPGHAFRMIDFCTNNFSMHREWFARTGGFDESFRVYGHEDRELFLRLRAAGVEVAFSAEAFARHHYERPFSELARDSVGRGRTAVLLARLHPALAGADPSELGDLVPMQKMVDGRLAPNFVRDSLLVLSERVPRLPHGVAALTEWWERRVPRLPPPLPFYRWAVQYYYWLGVRAALREASAP